MKKTIKTILLALCVMLLWGSLFPCIKLAYVAFDIDSSVSSNLLLFAGMRFLVCGLVILLFCQATHKDLKIKSVKQWVMVIAIGLFAIVLHYGFTYIGLAKIDSSKTAILKQLAFLIFIAFSFVFFKEDRFTVNKMMGAIFGFIGIVVLNLDGTEFTIGIGEILVISASCFMLISNILCKKLTKDVDAVVITGYSHFVGGVLLVLIGICSGGDIGSLSVKSAGIFAYICVASIVSYCLWNSILKNNNLSHLFIIKFTEPLFACIFSAILLGEDIFKWQNTIAVLLVSLGIILGSLQRTRKALSEQKYENCDKGEL